MDSAGYYGAGYYGAGYYGAGYYGARKIGEFLYAYKMLSRLDILLKQAKCCET